MEEQAVYQTKEEAAYAGGDLNPKVDLELKITNLLKDYDEVLNMKSAAQKQVADQNAIIAQLQQKVARYQIAISELACQILVK